MNQNTLRILGGGLLLLILSACFFFPQTPTAGFPTGNQVASGSAFYQGLALDSGLYYDATKDSIPIRVIGLRGLSPCLLQTPVWQSDTMIDSTNTVITGELIHWAISGSLNSQCAFPSTFKDTTIFLKPPTSSNGSMLRLFAETPYLDSAIDSTRYKLNVVDSFYLRAGFKTYDSVYVKIDSSNNITGLGSQTKIKRIPIATSGNYAQIWKIETCPVDQYITCSNFILDTLNSLSTPSDTTLADTIIHVIRYFCPQRNRIQCAGTITDSITSTIPSNIGVYWNYYTLAIDSNSSCRALQRHIRVTGISTDSRLNRFPMMQSWPLVRVWYDFSAGQICDQLPYKGLWLEKDSIESNLDSLKVWWNR